MVKKRIKNSGELVIYSGVTGSVELHADATIDTIWATQAQIIELFNIDQSVVSRHIRNIINEGEVNAKSNMQKMHITNSGKAITFRRWATKVLREYLVQGSKIDTNKIIKESAGFSDLKDAVAFIESKKHGRVKGKIVVKLTKEIL